jgi:hypothetical protein
MLELDCMTSEELARVIERLRQGGEADVDVESGRIHIAIKRVDAGFWQDGPECE